jgi:NAD(P)-dependent dehydrogenase (short-subunit alcohol dehydrogenase family)
MQALAETGSAARLWLVTQGSVGLDGAEAVPAVAQGALWGVGAVARLEHPEWRCVRVDVDGLAALVAELDRRDGEEQVAWRGGQRHVARLRRRAWPGAASSPSIRSDRSYVVTGGWGGLGLSVSEWLVEQGARHLLLLGRRGPSTAAAAVLADLRAKGARVETRAVDVADRQALAAALALCGRELPALAGVVHAAGELDDGALEQLDAGRFARVLAAKVAGAWHLHELTRDLGLEQFVLFSSAASLVGNPGQANHAAANAFLDGLAQHRRAQGLSGLSINWGAWAEVGAAARPEALAALARRGLKAMSTAAALSAFGRALADDKAQVGICDIDESTFSTIAVGHPFLESLVTASRTETGVAPQPERRSGATEIGAMRARIDASPPGQRHRMVEDEIAAIVATVLGTTQPINRKLGLFKAGLDSLSSIELRNRLQRAFGLSFAATMAMDYPTIADLAAHIAQQLDGNASETPASLETPTVVATPTATKVAEMTDAEIESMIDAQFSALDDA